MQNARQITKIVANNLVGFGIGSATSSIVHNNIRPSANPLINTVVLVSAFTTSWFVSSAVHNPVRDETERQIDGIFDFIENAKQSDSPTIKSV